MCVGTLQKELKELLERWTVIICVWEDFTQREAEPLDQKKTNQKGHKKSRM